MQRKWHEKLHLKYHSIQKCTYPDDSSAPSILSTWTVFGVCLHNVYVLGKYGRSGLGPRSKYSMLMLTVHLPTLLICIYIYFFSCFS